LKPAAIDHGRRNCRRGNAQQALQRLTACYHASGFRYCVDLNYVTAFASRRFQSERV
jgi:hypothetical protein